jgi:hypothetical protein
MIVVTYCRYYNIELTMEFPMNSMRGYISIFLLGPKWLPWIRPRGLVFV